MTVFDKNFNEMTDFERCIFRAYGMLKDRQNFWENCGGGTAEASAYRSAVDILEYAMKEDWIALNNFDYYNDDPTEEWACTPEEVNKVCEV